MFERIENYGLVNATQKVYGGHKQTYRKKGARPFQMDYFFISSKLAPAMSDCKVLYNKDIEKLSDHKPILLKLEISGQ